MPTNENQAESKPLSVNDAIQLLDQHQQPIASEEVANDSETTTETDAPVSDTPEPKDESEPTTSVDAPASWDEQAKARFAELPADIQALIASRESQHENALSSARSEAENAKRDVESRVSTEIGTLKAALDKLIPEATKTFKSRWADIDWTTLSEKVGTDEAFKLKAQFEKERDQLQQLETAQKAADDRAYSDFVKAESVKLKAVAPDLADAEKGQGRREALGRFLTSNGYTADQIRFMTAHDASIAYDAMRWREAETKARAAAKAKPAPKTAAPAKPSALPAARTAQPKKGDDAFRRLTKTGRVDDAVAYLNARSR